MTLSALATVFLAAPPAHPQDLSAEGQAAWREARLEAVRRDDAVLLASLTQSGYGADQVDRGHLLTDAFQANVPLTELLARVAQKAPTEVRAQLTLGLLDRAATLDQHDRPAGDLFARLALLGSQDPSQRYETITTALIRAFHCSGDAAGLVAQARPYLPLDAGLRALNQAWPKTDVPAQHALWPLVHAWLTDLPAQDFVPRSDAVQAMLVKGLRLATAVDDVARFTFVRQLPGAWTTDLAIYVLERAIEGHVFPEVLKAFWSTEADDQRLDLYSRLAEDGIDAEGALAHLAGVARLDPSLDPRVLTRVLLKAVTVNGDTEDRVGHLDEMDLERFVPYLDAPTLLAEIPAQGPLTNAQSWARLICDRLLPEAVLAHQGQVLVDLPGPDLARTRAILRRVALQAHPVQVTARARRRS